MRVVNFEASGAGAVLDLALAGFGGVRNSSNLRAAASGFAARGSSANFIAKHSSPRGSRRN
jgi:hypothetical protein